MDHYLGFTVIAAIVATCGTILGFFIKDFLFVRHFDHLKEKNTLNAISKRYQDPILLAAIELARRVKELKEAYITAPKAFTEDTLFNKTAYLKTNRADDVYFLKYKIVSTLYRFCAFFGWLELYRQDITFLNSHSKKESAEFLKILGKIRESIADGQINDRQGWKDGLVFREELRAVGEGMIEVMPNQRVILGYGKFQSIMNNYELNKEPIWIRPVINFFIDFQVEKDFRMERLELLFIALKKLIMCLNAAYYKEQVHGI